MKLVVLLAALGVLASTSAQAQSSLLIQSILEGETQQVSLNSLLSDPLPYNASINEPVFTGVPATYLHGVMNGGGMRLGARAAAPADALESIVQTFADLELAETVQVVCGGPCPPLQLTASVHVQGFLESFGDWTAGKRQELRSRLAVAAGPQAPSDQTILVCELTGGPPVPGCEYLLETGSMVGGLAEVDHVLSVTFDLPASGSFSLAYSVESLNRLVPGNAVFFGATEDGSLSAIFDDTVEWQGIQALDDQGQPFTDFQAIGQLSGYDYAQAFSFPVPGPRPWWIVAIGLIGLAQAARARRHAEGAA